MTDLLKRSASGLLLIGFMVGAVLWNGWSLTLLLCLIQVFGLLEFYHLSEAKGHQPLKLLGIAGSLGLTGLLFADLHFALLMPRLSWMPPILLFLCLSSHRHRIPQPAFLVDLGLTGLGWLYLTAPMLLILLLSYKTGTYQGLLILFLLTLVWLYDTMAYLTGKTLGRHRMAPELSPGKTWEGTIGGLVASTAGGAVWVLGNGIDLLLVQAAASGFLIGFGAVLGDLFQSALKRRVEWEDSGSLIPGHGGVLDRFDGLVVSVMLAFPLLYNW